MLDRTKRNGTERVLTVESTDLVQWTVLRHNGTEPALTVDSTDLIWWTVLWHSGTERALTVGSTEVRRNGADTDGGQRGVTKERSGY